MPRRRGAWEYRGHWIDNNVKGSASYYAYWYDDAKAQQQGRQSRKSLKTADLEAAKDELVAFVLQRKTESKDALVLSVIGQYVDEVASHLPSAEQALRSKELFKEVLEGPERISDLTEEFQVRCMLKKWRASHGHSAGYLSRNMSVLSAAVRHCGIKDAPEIIYDRKTIAKLLRIPPPTAGKWFPRDDDDLARFIDGLGSELAFRWTLIALNTACRPEAGLDLGPDQVDRKNGLVDLSPPGRPQQPTKLRPVLRLTDCLRGWVEHWEARKQDIKGEDEHALLLRTAPWKLRLRYVPYRQVDSLQSVYNRTRAAVDLRRMVPYSIRNKMITVLRQRQVPGIQRSQWLGHADEEESRTTSRSYGEFDPDYLRDAADATDSFLWELNKRTDRDLFAPSHCKFTASSGSVRDTVLLPVEKSEKYQVVVVGAAGIEPATPTMST